MENTVLADLLPVVSMVFIDCIYFKIGKSTIEVRLTPRNFNVASMCKTKFAVDQELVRILD